MAWSIPNIFTAGTAPAAAEFNKVRDSLKAIGDPWTSYTPTWTAATTNPTIGNGTITGNYILAGKLCHFRAIVTIGSTTTLGTGAYQLTLPFAPVSGGYPITFPAVAYVTGPASSFPLRALSRQATTALDLLADPATAGASWRTVTQTIPTAWAAGNNISVSGTYEVA